MSTELTHTLKRWAATRRDEIVFDPSKGFYSFDIVADAFEKGKEIGKAEFVERARGLYFDNAEIASELLDSLIKFFTERDAFPNKAFIKNAVFGISILIIIDAEKYENNDFLDMAYAFISKMKLEQYEKGKSVQISIMCNSDHIDFHLLMADGYGFGFDFRANTQIKES